MAKGDLTIKTYRQEGDLAHEYNPFRNIVNQDNQIVDFNTDELEIDLNNPLNIECQPSYDGTVNLIINDDKNPPRIINSRFSKTEDNRYKIINRNQIEQTNLYREGKIDQQTRLFRNINKIPKIDLMNISNMGQLKGGNYTFYIKFADNDFNKTDIVAESGQVSIFKGYLNKIESISGTLLDELTDKAVTLKLSNVDTSFSKMYVYFTRETSDTNGIRITKAGMFSTPYEITSSTEYITINGYEDVEELSPEEINIKYNLVTAAKTQAQVQNMLFFGNVQGTIINVKDLQNISYFIKVGLRQAESIGWVSEKNYKQKNTDDISQAEYYSPKNIYYKLGYWPDELYRLGIVYIMNDDSLSPVFNLRGCKFDDTSSYNCDGTGLFKDSEKTEMNYLERDTFLSGGNYLDNTFGVFKNSDATVINYGENSGVKPLYYKIELPNDVIYALSKCKVKGYFIVRQKRIPTTLCQGLSIGIDRSSYVPMLYDNTNANYFTESFLSTTGSLVNTFEAHRVTTSGKQCSGLLSVDANIVKTLQSTFDGSEFVFKPYATVNGTLTKDTEYSRHFWVTQDTTRNIYNSIQAGAIFVNSETPLKYVNGYGYSTKCGAQEDVSQFSFFGEKNYSAENHNLLRGIYTPFIGIGTSLMDNTIYDVKVPNFTNAALKDYFSVRGNDTAPFYAVSDRYELSTTSVDVYRGDCYSNTVTIRLNRNFVDSEVPINDNIIDLNTWSKNYKGYQKMINSASVNNSSSEDEEKDKDKEDRGNFANINRADVNAVSLGMWVTYKCLSNYNLGLRSEDRSHTDEFALMGSSRSFYPLAGMSTVVSQKVEESWLLNDGYSATVGHRRNFIADNVPYIKELFDNRIMFSNVQQDDDFRNAYRIFQGLSFKDIDRQYGAIVKFVPWGVNILCIFEHGIGIIPINEKALIQTNTSQSIHMYGAGVLQNQISLVSSDFGSIWPESIIRTPIGVYGVDTYAKKIWRYSDGKGLEIISDMKVQQFLNDNIKLSEQDKYPIIGIKNVKSHYNNNKGDIMFTFYNVDGASSYKTSEEHGSDIIVNSIDSSGVWNLCFNERLDKWITRYSWTPLYSENINNIFYSLDQNRAKILGYIYNNKHCTYGLHTSNSQWSPNSTSSSFNTTLSTVGYKLADSFSYTIKKVTTSYLNENDEEIDIIIDNPTLIGNHLFSINNSTLTSKTYSSMEEWFSLVYGAHLPLWYKIDVDITLHIGSGTSTISDVLGIVVDNQVLKSQDLDTYNKLRNAFLKNGFYVHGRAGIFNEIKYEDESFDNQILPTKWYEKQEPFEFEFVVNAETGLHKIFDNLVIISNNVQPNEIEYEIEGDVYGFNKAGIFRDVKWPNKGYLWNIKYNKPKEIENPLTHQITTYQGTQDFKNCTINWDTTLNTYSLIVNQNCKNINKWGRRLGNIQYKEDSWYLNIEPILFTERFKINNSEEQVNNKVKSTRIRDKYCKIRVKYTGEDLVIITALKTLYTQSYA